MPEVNNIEKLRKWFRGCTALSAKSPFRVDYLSEEPVEYSLISLPSTIAYHENVLGENVPNEKQKIQFLFASNEFWGADPTQNAINFGFYQDVTRWIIEQNAACNFPEIDNGRVLSIVPTLSQYVAAPGTDSARYQIQIELLYKMVL